MAWSRRLGRLAIELDLIGMVLGAATEPGLGERVPLGQVALRLGLAGLMGAIIGVERSIADKPADARTMILIAVGAAAFALLGQDLMMHAPINETIRTDSTRVLSYIITGVGFLGAGAILHSKKSVRGLTTAAAIWAVAALGAACGVGSYEIALVLFAFVAATMWGPWLLHLKRDDNGNGANARDGGGLDPP